MPVSKKKHTPQPNAVVTVFEDFLGQLADDLDLDDAIVERFRSALLENDTVEADHLRTALFGKPK